ncbi:MAG: DUF2791 family P-loop domain-containing protein [Geodermatophilaceae bacterium]|nr:DUF2791 family P-loop domain-containing protein [Geodermatophilaceae bacterium]MDQ3465269.1 ATP-binding protein [Actinomycetota bacterium]
MTDIRGSGLPLGGTGLTCESYLEFLAADYLATYIRSGGAAVRFVVAGSDDVSRRWHAGLAEVARAQDCLYVGLDAAETKMAMIDQIYATVARQVDWEDLVRRTLRTAWAAVGLPADEMLTVSAVAARHDVDAPEASRTIRRQLETALLGDTTLAREFRLAVLRLCQAELVTGDVIDVEKAAVLAWLRVEPVALRALRSASIYSRVGRHNARALLLSLTAWRQRMSGSGLVIDIDLDRLAVARRPPVEQRSGLYYTKAAILDAYEVLRQLIDAADALRGVLIAVTLPPELITDEVRGLPAYSALQLRIVDEVRDKRRANPYAALVRLETRLEVVP